MSKVPADLKYTKTHEWLRTLADGTIEIGITDHAQHALGDLVFVEVPEAGRALKAGEMLDGEGGYTVYAKLIPAASSLERNALPIGLAHHVKVLRDIAAGEIVCAADVALDGSMQAVRIRRDMEQEARQAGIVMAAE